MILSFANMRPSAQFLHPKHHLYDNLNSQRTIITLSEVKQSILLLHQKHHFDYAHYPLRAITTSFPKAAPSVPSPHLKHHFEYMLQAQRTIANATRLDEAISAPEHSPPLIGHSSQHQTAL